MVVVGVVARARRCGCVTAAAADFRSLAVLEDDVNDDDDAEDARLLLLVVEVKSRRREQRGAPVLVVVVVVAAAHAISFILYCLARNNARNTTKSRDDVSPQRERERERGRCLSLPTNDGTMYTAGVWVTALPLVFFFRLLTSCSGARDGACVCVCATERWRVV